MADLLFSQILKTLGLSKSPYFGDLYLKPHKYPDLFKYRDSLVSSVVDRINSGIDSRNIIISGHPGVGKSTILDYLSRYPFKNRMRRISLASRLPVMVDWGYTEFSVEQFIFIFEEVEKFLNLILSENNIDHPKTSTSEIRFRYQQLQSEIPFVEFTRDIIIPKCVKIHEMGDSIPRYILAIDDVDYIFPFYQKDFLSVLCSMAEVSLNPLIIYSARPVATGVAVTHINSYMSHRFGPPIIVEPIDAYNVIETRIRDVAKNKDQFINPFTDTNVQDILRRISNSNLRLALILAEDCLFKCNIHNRPPDYIYNFNTIINTLFNEPASSKDSHPDIEATRQLCNIFHCLEPGDPAPFLYVTLISLMRPLYIEESYFSYFNKVISDMNPSFKDAKINESRILEILIKAHKLYLIRRIEHIDYSKISTNKDQYKPENRVLNHKMSLTEKGSFLLNLTKNSLFQDLTALKSWRASISNYVTEIKIDIQKTDPYGLVPDTKGSLDKYIKEK